MNNELTLKTENCIVKLNEYEEKLLDIFSHLWLPTENVFVSIDNRKRFLANTWDILNQLDSSKKQWSLYLSKFLWAINAWLFDAALNYLWDETIKNLREKIYSYDIWYFIDNLDTSTDKKDELKRKKDLSILNDNELLIWALKLELISDIGFKKLDIIRDMRNWASAAHPNHIELSPYDLLSYFETCLNEIISKDTPDLVIEIWKLFYDIKNSILSESEIKKRNLYVSQLPKKQIWTFVNGLFWIYIDDITEVKVVDNINNLLKDFNNDLIDIEIKRNLGLKYWKLEINWFKDKWKKARDFLKLLKIESFIPKDLKSSEIKDLLSSLLSVHYEYNNFYQEPPYARELKNLVWELGDVPEDIERDYVLWIINVYLSNGNWISYIANEIYLSLIKSFTKSQALIAMTSFKYEDISRKLRYSIWKKQFIKMLDILDSKFVDTNISNFVTKIRKYELSLDKLIENKSFSEDIKTLKLLVR